MMTPMQIGQKESNICLALITILLWYTFKQQLNVAINTHLLFCFSV